MEGGEQRPLHAQLRKLIPVDRHTGTTELPLTANGEKRIISTGKALVGDDRLIVPQNLAHMFVSWSQSTSWSVY